MINAINDYMLPCWCVSCSSCLLLVAPLALLWELQDIIVKSEKFAPTEGTTQKNVKWRFQVEK